VAEPTGLVEAAGRGGGAIVHLSSTAGVESVGSPAGWVSATHGVMGLTKVAALDYPGRGDRGDGGRRS
jgi:NAD(P)-dependent dehydrogenase (short-subunit alcohol dehydrogenase family)